MSGVKIVHKIIRRVKLDVLINDVAQQILMLHILHPSLLIPPYPSLCESLEDMASPSEINDLEFPSSNMSVAFLDSSIENQKGGYIKPNCIKLLKYPFPCVAPLLSPSGTLSPLGSYCLSLPPHFPHSLHSDKCHRSGQGHEIHGR